MKAARAFVPDPILGVDRHSFSRDPFPGTRSVSLFPAAYLSRVAGEAARAQAGRLGFKVLRGSVAWGIEVRETYATVTDVLFPRLLVSWLPVGADGIFRQTSVSL